MPRNLRRADRSDGFTLIELLVVVVIIGILAAIAIPVFLTQKAKAYDAQVKTQVNTVAKSVEAVLAQDGSGGSALAVEAGGKQVGFGGGSEPVVVTAGTDWSVAGGANGYCVVAWSLSGGRYKASAPLLYDSTRGGLQPTGSTCNPTVGAPADFTTGGAAPAPSTPASPWSGTPQDGWVGGVNSFTATTVGGGSYGTSYTVSTLTLTTIVEGPPVGTPGLVTITILPSRRSR